MHRLLGERMGGGFDHLSGYLGNLHCPDRFRQENRRQRLKGVLSSLFLMSQNCPAVTPPPPGSLLYHSQVRFANSCWACESFQRGRLERSVGAGEHLLKWGGGGHSQGEAEDRKLGERNVERRK